jgi:amino acid adenylation domain-containing protein
VPSGLHETVLEAARRFPGEPAWISADSQLSYGELDRRSSWLASWLHAMGIGAGQIVGLRLRRGPGMAIAMLGVLRAGAAYLPIALDEPAGRLRAMLDDATPAVIVTDGDLAALTSGHEQFAVPAQDSAAAYVIYTSGSTGMPKGVLIEHRNLAGHLTWLRRNLPLNPGDRLLQVAPYTFDASVTDFFWPLSSGAAVVSLAEGDQADPAVLASTLAGQSITAVRLPPAILPPLLDEPLLAEVTELRYLMCGGDRLAVPLARRVAQRLPRARLFNRYGPTEAAVAVTYHEFLPAEHFAPGDVPIGRPVDGARLYIGNDQLAAEPAPGLSGELIIGGLPVARGYLRDENDGRFTAIAGIGRVFRSGDWVTVNEAGELIFLGRHDDQVQVAGHRVELGEIRAALSAHPRVADCAIMLTEDDAVTAYVVPAGPAPTQAEFRAFLLTRLPGYMMPVRIAFRQKLPVTSRGKLDIAALTEYGTGTVG